MKRKGKNSEKKGKKEINGRFTHKLSRQGFFLASLFSVGEKRRPEMRLLLAGYGSPRPP